MTQAHDEESLPPRAERGEGQGGSVPEDGAGSDAAMRPDAPAGQALRFELPEGFVDPGTQALVKRAQDGDVQALNDLFARYHSLMVEIARRRLGPRLRLKEDPDDLAQTTFREATRDFKHYEYRGEGSLLSWLVHILQNKIRDRAEFYAAGKRDAALELEPLEREHEVPVPELAARDLSVTRQVARDERREMLRDALGHLTP